MMQLSTTKFNLIASILCGVLVACTAVQSLLTITESDTDIRQVFEFHAARELKEDIFVTDPSANVEGIFKKVGDMTFILNTDLLSDDFEEGKRKKRNAVLDTRKLWPGGVVPYEISSYFDEQEERLILSAMRHWENKTCIRFRPKHSTDQYSIFIMTGPILTCQSFVGRINVTKQPQGVTLGEGCVYFPTVVHELGHVIGFYHEHSRPDRDEHVEIKLSNVRPFALSNFNKLAAGTTNLLGYGYDYASIMHYDKDAFSANKEDTIVAKDPSIPFGDAWELSPLDITKTIKLYNCGPESTWPRAQTILSSDTLSLPTGITCGQVSNGHMSGAYISPGYPSYRHNLDCAYVIKVPKGYHIKLTVHKFNIETTDGCSKDYMEVYVRNRLISERRVMSSTFQNYGIQTTEGRFCNNRGYTFSLERDVDFMTVYFHTDGSGSGRRGLNVTFTAIDDDECESNNCHQCNNLPGGHECVCRDGYYHSTAAATCYDVNECAYSNGGCNHICINSGGSYRCECNSGYYLQADGKSCTTTATTTPSPTTTSAFTTTSPPTTTSTFIATHPPPQCGGLLNTSSGTFQTPNWPQTYPNNIDCEWRIQLPDASKVVEIGCEEEPYGIAGSLPHCEKDFLKFYDGHSKQDTEFGPFCYFTKPSTAIMSSNKAMAVFHSGPRHSSSRKGFKCSFQSVDVPRCGGTLTAASGSFQTFNWPKTYPVNINCTWTIILPDSSQRVQITFDSPFGIAGSLPTCKDELHIYDNNTGTQYGPYCYFTVPNPPIMTSNRVTVEFVAGPSHSPSRVGFRATYNSVA